MDKTIDLALLAPCIGAATTLVVNKGPLQNRDEAHVVGEIHKYAFDLYFAFQTRVDNHNAQVYLVTTPEVLLENEPDFSGNKERERDI